MPNNTVFILGAGASAECHAPLMSNFFDRMEDLVYQHGKPQDKKDWEILQKARFSLQRSASKAALNTNNLESVFVALEMMEFIGGIKDQEKGIVGAKPAIEALKRLIAFTLTYAIYWDESLRRKAIPPDNHIQMFWQPDFGTGYKTLSNSLGSARGKQHTIDFVTFNYDTLLEQSLNASKIAHIVVTARNDAPTPGTRRICKMHGSLDWELEKRLIVRKPTIPVVSTSTGNDRICRMNSLLDTNDNPITPLLVPPTENKAEHRKVMQPIWAHAKEILTEAANIVVIGFSLPPTDEYFRTFFSLATIGQTTLRNFIVIDPSEAVAQRYQSMLSRLAQDRFQWISTGFGEGIPKALNMLGII